MRKNQVPSTLDGWKKQSDTCYSYNTGFPFEVYLLLDDGTAWHWEAYGNISLLGFGDVINDPLESHRRSEGSFETADMAQKDLIANGGIDFPDYDTIMDMDVDEVSAQYPYLAYVPKQYIDEKCRKLEAKLPQDAQGCVDGACECSLQPGVVARFVVEGDSTARFVLLVDGIALFRSASFLNFKDARDAFMSIWLPDTSRFEEIWEESDERYED